MLQSLNNYVLIDPAPENDSIDLNGSKFYIDNTYEKEMHAVTNGLVISVPEKLIFGRETSGLEYDVDMELKVGDRAYFHFNSIARAIKDKRTFVHKDRKMVMIRYDSIYCAKRENEIVMINGWLLVEPIKEKVESKFEIAEFKKHSGQKGVVRHIGSIIKNYKDRDDKDTNEIAPGDTVMFLPQSDIPLEYSLHETIGSEFFRMQRKDILCKLN